MRYLNWIIVSLAFPSTIQFLYGFKRRAIILLLSFLALPCLFSYSGLLFVEHSFTVFLSLQAVLWLFIVIDAIICARKSIAYTGSYQYVAYALVVALLVYPAVRFKRIVYGFEVFRIPSVSMYPKLKVGDLVLANTRWGIQDSIKAGDIVIFKRSGLFMIKRLVGEPNETVRVDGFNLQNSSGYSRKYPHFFGKQREWQTGPDEVFVVGDNVPKSRDSRATGAVKLDDVVGVYQYTLN